LEFRPAHCDTRGALGISATPLDHLDRVQARSVIEPPRPLAESRSRAEQVLSLLSGPAHAGDVCYRGRAGCLKRSSWSNLERAGSATDFLRTSPRLFNSLNQKCHPQPRRVVGGGSDLQLTSTVPRTSAVWASTKIKLPVRIRACGVVSAKSGGSLMTLGSA
jgi:hypothetical protein